MKFLRTFLHKFCSFWSFGVYLPSSMMVDYTEREERLREKSFCMFQMNITSSPRPHHREKNYEEKC